MKVGVVGCGAMGRPMAEAMRAAGADVRGLDLTVDGMGALGDVVSTDPRSFVDREVVFTVVRDAAQTDAILFGPDAFLPFAGGLRTLVLCSTLSPRYLADLPARLPDVALVDAPMSGAPVAAEERRLSFMLGGPMEEIEALWPLLGAMGEHFHHLGPFGSGMTAKVLNNLVAAASTAASRTALAWGRALGLDEATMLDVLADSSGQTWFGLNFHRIAWAREEFAPGNTLGILVKDLEAARDAAPPGADTALPDALIDVIRGLDRMR